MKSHTKLKSLRISATFVSNSTLHVYVALECDHEPFLLSVFLLSAWKKDLVGGAGRRQFIFQPWTP